MRNTKNILNQLIEKIRLFLSELTWKESLTFFLFLFISTIFWGMQVYSERMEIKLTIPIKYTNNSESILFENELPTEIEVLIKDYGSAALKYLTKNNDSITIDIASKIKEPSSKRILQNQDLEQLVKGTLYPNSELLGFFPTYISFAYSKVAVKKLPVVFDGLANLSIGYQLDGDITIEPDTIIAYGTSGALDTLKYAYTSKDTLDIDKNQSFKVALRSNKGVTFKPNEITLNVPVDEFIDKDVKVPVTCINLPEDLEIKFFPPDIKVSFSIGKKRNNLVNANNFKIIVDYNDIQKLKTNSIPIRIIESPDFAKIKHLEPSEVEFIFEQH